MNSFEIILVLTLIILGAILSYNWKELSNLRKVTLVVFIMLSLLVQLINYKSNKKIEKAEILQKEKTKIIDRIHAKFGEVNTSGVSVSKFMIGHQKNGSVIVRDGAVFSYKVIEAKNKVKEFLRINLEKDRLLVNCIIRNFSGEVIAVLEDSVWTVFDENYEYNDDEFGFELVTKGERSVFFQIFHTNGLTHISGYLITPDGRGLLLYSNPVKNGSIIFSCKNNCSEDKYPKPSELQTPRIFKYPREKHYGVRL